MKHTVYAVTDDGFLVDDPSRPCLYAIIHGRRIVRRGITYTTACEIAEAAQHITLAGQSEFIRGRISHDFILEALEGQPREVWARLSEKVTVEIRHDATRPDDISMNVSDGLLKISIAPSSSATLSARILPSLVFHEIGHLAAARDADIWRPNFGMIPVRLMCSTGRLRPETERRMLKEEVCAFLCWAPGADYKRAARRGHHAAGLINSSLRDDTRKTNPEFRDLINEALEWRKTLDLEAELKRKFELIAAGPPN